MSGSKSKSQQTSQTTNTSVGIGGANSGLVATGNSQIEMTATDHGAIKESYDFGEKSLDFAADSLDNMLDFSDNNIGRVFELGTTIVEASVDSAKDANDDLNSVVSESQKMIYSANNQTAATSENMQKLLMTGAVVMAGILAMGKMSK